VLSQAIAKVSVKQRTQGVPYATGPTNRPAASVGLSTQRLMSKQMQILQLNMQKRRGVQHSVMNDASLKGYTALAISEPYVFEMDRKVRTNLIGHQSWTAILPSQRHDGRWAMRSMLWVRKDIECEQVNVPLADLTVALLRLPDRSVLLASVYVEGANSVALVETLSLLDDATSTA